MLEKQSSDERYLSEDMYLRREDSGRRRKLLKDI